MTTATHPRLTRKEKKAQQERAFRENQAQQCEKAIRNAAAVLRAPTAAKAVIVFIGCPPSILAEFGRRADYKVVAFPNLPTIWLAELAAELYEQASDRTTLYCCVNTDGTTSPYGSIAFRKLIRRFGSETITNTYTPTSLSEWRHAFRFLTNKDIYEEPIHDASYDAFDDEPSEPRPIAQSEKAAEKHCPIISYAERSQPPED